MPFKPQAARIREFVDYHVHGDGECNNVVLKEWARRHGLTDQERFELSFMFSVTYCVESAIICFETQKKEGRLSKAQLQELKPQILFQSDRKYMRMKDNFERCMADFYDNHRDFDGFLYNVSTGKTIRLEKAVPYVETWEMFGRFAAFLFLETLVELTDYSVVNTTIDWPKGDTATSGLLNLYGYDKAADHFDRTGKLIIEPSKMDLMLYRVIAYIEQADGQTNVTQIETSLCAYRKFYKGSRYNGYYLDRMLEEINAMKALFPVVSRELLEIRRSVFDRKYLGEINGWNGIRKELKKHYILHGEIT